MTTRNYDKLTGRLEALSAAHLRVETAGVVEGYPVYHVALQSETGASGNLLLTAGVHGDEPAGVEAALRFLERDHVDLLERFSFMVVPA